MLKDELRDDDSKSDLIDEKERKRRRKKKNAYIVFCFVILGMRQSNYR